MARKFKFYYLQNMPDVNAKIREIRQEILRFFNTTEDNHCVIFTSGTTQGLKIVVENFDFETQNGTFLYLDECHTSVVGLRELVENYEIFNVFNFDRKLSNQNGLVTFPAMSNFNGQKFPMKKWIKKCHESNYKVLLDAASFISTNPLDLQDIEADFVTISFYKIFGYPTGLGALVVKNSSLKYLKYNF